jgi:corrinoid protein of di/trimethylamine methyltransferase
MSIFNDISAALVDGKHKIVGELTQKAIDEGAAPKDILEQALLAGMDIIGVKFEQNEIFVPEVLVAARAMNAGVSVIKPLLAASGVEPAGRACIGTIKGDLHDIGKNLVRMMLEGKGFEVFDLGNNVAPETFYQTAVDKKCDVVAVSTLLTTTMLTIQSVIKLFEEKGYRDKVKIMVGGAPISQKFADQIGADGWAPNAAAAADLALTYVK